MLIDSAKQFENSPTLKGELVLVLQGADKTTSQMSDKEVKELIQRRLQTISLRDAVKEMEEISGLPRKQIYQLALSISKNKS